ncbi:MAG: ribosomal protein S18-alanine N-acetyltransferase [Clostridia bacterium]|nr:ribosomal protein S18-alanine N-acetyltransferase [Clostridia bacterium]
MNIVFICTGNTCRSPMAAGIFSKKTEKFSQYLNVSSCGTGAMVGDTASLNAISVMTARGIDISDHRSRPVNQYIIDDADFIICISPSHYNALLPYAKDKLIMLGAGIPDPYMGNEDVYSQCADMIETEIDKLLASDIFLEISEMTKDDIDTVAQIEKDNFSEPWSYDSFVSQLNKNYAINFTVRYLGKPIGYICCDDIIGEVNVNTVAVDKTFRRRGIGSILINKTVEWCKNNNSDSLTLEVRESNIPAINLYSKFGFEILGKRKNFYSKPIEDALIMTKYFNGDNK